MVQRVRGQVGNIPEAVKQRVMGMKKSDLSIEDRRRLYNQMGRRMKHTQELPAGMLEKYTSALGCADKRFDLLKHFICDRGMRPS